MSSSPTPYPVNADERAKRLAEANYARIVLELSGVAWSPDREAVWKQYVNGEITARERNKALKVLHQQ